jgi:hypothetical protein
MLGLGKPVSQMHCLYCDRPLALLKRLTGDGEFCSKEHRRIYQKEHNQLGLARLLESQPSSKPKRPGAPSISKPAPAAPAPVQQPGERQPEPADFISGFLQEASAAAGPNRSLGGPRFESRAPLLGEPAPAEGARDVPGLRPKTASFLFESQALPFAGVVRFPGKSTLEPLARAPRLKGPVSDAAATAIRRQPAGAGFIAAQTIAPARYKTGIRHTASGAAPQPQFSRVVPAKADSGDSCQAGVPKLSLAAALSASRIAARSIPGLVRRFGDEPRWKPLAAALPIQPMGKIILVLGSFLRRPVRIASQDTLPENFEIRFRPISFPQYPPLMGILAERPHRMERIGFTPQ